MDKVKMKQDSTKLDYFNCSPCQTMTDVLCKLLFMSFLISVLMSSSLRRLIFCCIDRLINVL